LPMFIGLGIGFGIRYVVQQGRRSAALEKAAQAVSGDVRNNLLHITYWLAALLRRCGSEFALLKEMPPDIQIITRRVLLDKLKATETWQHIPASARDLLLKPDGHWTAQERAFVADRFEFLAVLRWILRQDSTLRLLSFAPGYDYRSARELTDDTSWMNSAFVRGPVEIAPRAKSANAFMERCWVEGIVRGLVEVDTETRARADEYKRKLAADAESTDVLYGVRTISELSSQDLRAVYLRASLRVQLLRCVLGQMDGSIAFDQLGRLIVEGCPGAS
jgi:hypothetical protein